jgi:hypothetical protein
MATCQRANHLDSMIADDSQALKERIEVAIHRRIHKPVAIIDHSQSYTAIAPGTVLRIDGSDFYIHADAKEGRFGIDEQPKLWVKHAFDLSDGTRKIIKLVFHEQFDTRLGTLAIRCTRRPDKESRALAAVTGDHRFMQGRTVYDRFGNNIRIIDFIRGKTLYNLVSMLEQPHEQYFRETLPSILRHVLGCIEALGFLHARGIQHGDVRNDHIIIESDSGNYRWIDFDYEANYLDFDIWSVGNILSFAVGQGTVTCRKAQSQIDERPGGGRIGPGDALTLYPHRLANLRQLYRYIPEELNDMLMRFSASTNDFYDSVEQIAADLRRVLEGSLPERAGVIGSATTAGT